MIPFAGEDRDVYNLPHRSIITIEKTTTKVRPVFTASALTATGVMVNPFRGPKLPKLKLRKSYLGGENMNS